MAARQAAGAVKTAPVRIRPPEPDLHAAVEARADAACARRPRLRLGRPAHADHCRVEAARRAAGGGARIRQAHRRGKSQQRGRCRHAGVLHSRAPQQIGAAADGGAAAAEGRDRELSGRPGRGARGRQPSRRSGRRHAKDFVRPRALYRARRFHGEPAEKILPPVAGQRGAAALRLFRQMHRRHQERRRRSGRTALHLRSRHQGRQRARWTQGQGHHALAVGRAVGAGGNPRLQSAVRQPQPERREFRRRPQSGIAGNPARRADRAFGGSRTIRAR